MIKEMQPCHPRLWTLPQAVDPAPGAPAPVPSEQGICPESPGVSTLISVTVTNTTAKSNIGKKGFIWLAFQFIFHHWGQSEQGLK